MEATDAVLAPDRAPAATARGLGSGAPSARSDRSIDGVLARGLARLIEGQRQFGQEFGLPFSRIFTDEFESFRGRNPEAVVRDWLADAAAGDRLETLFDDLLAHQLALLAALDDAVLQGIRRERRHTQGIRAAWKHALRSMFFAPKSAEVHTGDQTLRYLHIVAPAFLARYARERQRLAVPDFLAALKQKTEQS